MQNRKSLKLIGIITVFILIAVIFFFGYKLSYNKNIESINTPLSEIK